MDLRKALEKWIIVALILVLIAGYFLSKPAVYLKNKPAKEMQCKFYPFRDSVLIFLPYIVTVFNNRFQLLQLSGVNDDRPSSGFNRLIFNKNGVEINSLYDPTFKDLQDNYIQNTYRKTIFPFTNRNFYFFRSHLLSQKEFEFDFEKYTREEILVQLKDLSKNFHIKRNKAMIDSLYKEDENQSINIYFGKGLASIDLRAKLNRNEQKLVIPQDSIRDMSKDEAKMWLQNYYNKIPISDSF